MIRLQWVTAVVLLGVMSALGRPAWAAGGVYQIGVVRMDGARTTGSAVQLFPGRLLASCHTVRQARDIVVLHANRPFRAVVDRSDAHHDLCLLRTARFSGGVPERVASNLLRVGEDVSAYGFASGFRMSIARGRITALHRFDDASVIRTSARFPRGASGGALFDDRGRLIGLLTFQARDPALNYALPMEWVERLLEQGEDAESTVNVTAFWDQPADRQPAFLRASQLEYEGNWPALKAVGQAWSEREPSDAHAWRSLGRAQFGTGETQEALQSLARAVALEPEGADAWYWLGRTAAAAGDGVALRQALDRLYTLDTDRAGQLDAETRAPRQ